MVAPASRCTVSFWLRFAPIHVQGILIQDNWCQSLKLGVTSPCLRMEKSILSPTLGHHLVGDERNDCAGKTANTCLLSYPMAISEFAGFSNSGQSMHCSIVAVIAHLIEINYMYSLPTYAMLCAWCWQAKEAKPLSLSPGLYCFLFLNGPWVFIFPYIIPLSIM